MIEENNLESNCDVEDIKEENFDDSSSEDTQKNQCCSNLEEENISLKNEMDDLKNKFLRVSAEYDNYRKRTSKEKEELYGNACLDVITQILPILDNLERASSVDSDFDSLKKGIDMVTKIFGDVLDKLGVKEIDSTGKFDPNFHEAVMHIDDQEFDEKTIVEVFQKGYIRNDKVIRHSMVKVAN